MGRQHTLQNITHLFVRVLLAVCLVMGLAPVVAQADTPLEVKVEAPAQVNKTVELESDDGGVEVADDASADVSGDAASTQSAPGQVSSEVVLESHDLASKSSQITTDVTLVANPDTQTETMLVDGLTYLVDRELQSAPLTGWYGNAPAG
ncbi:MAG: hypothetical protein RR505_07175, partial [Raoultibacter sp.]